MIFGADYYPEQWTPQDWDEDIRLMRSMGLTSVRLAEFAWALMEPREGHYDFSFFTAIIDKLQSAGISVILGTPTATFPPWLYKKYPQIVQTRDGIVRQIGTRRQACFASKEFRNAAGNIVTAMARAFGKHPNVIGWQIDNEIGHEGSDQDHSPVTRRAFQDWLRRRYGAIDALNECWGGAFWGIVYSDFDEIPLPVGYVASTYNPTMIQDYYRFQSDTIIDFVGMQSEIVRHYSDAPLTTNLYNSAYFTIIDMAALARYVDYISWDFYPVWGDMDAPFPHPFLAAIQQNFRGLKNRSFCVMEQISGFQGHTKLGYLPAPGQTALWLTHSIAHGADSIYFFRFRTARFGQEQLCYGLLDHDKEPTDRMRELQKAITQLQNVADDFVAESYPARVALIGDIENARNFRQQPVSKGLEFSPLPWLQLGYDIELATWYSGFSVLNVNTHFMQTGNVDLNQYKVIALPLYAVVDAGFFDRVEQFVRNGGTLILGYRSGWKDPNLWMHADQPPGPFAEMAGVRVRQFEAVGDQKIKLRFRLLPGRGGKICELLEPTTARVVARYTDRRKFYKGYPAITRNVYHKGVVYYVGTSLTPESFVLLYRRVLREARVPFRLYGQHIERVYRTGRKNDYEIYMNHSIKPRWAGRRRLKPYEFRIVSRPKPPS
ncbi:MAG: beta-galactosidase [Leptospiraceae bacterium]|nr:beta-galactosidase [Leptospiraceae bacterium]